MFTTIHSTIARAILGTVGTALCAGVCLVAATAPAHAAESGRAPWAATVRSTTVRYADLDVASAKGRAVLARRLNSAARAVCTSADAGPLARIEEGRCVREALNAAKPAIG